MKGVCLLYSANQVGRQLWEPSQAEVIWWETTAVDNFLLASAYSPGEGFAGLHGSEALEPFLTWQQHRFTQDLSAPHYTQEGEVHINITMVNTFSIKGTTGHVPSGPHQWALLCAHHSSGKQVLLLAHLSV